MKQGKLEFFPRDTTIRLADAYFYLIVLGSFGVHQLYLGNRRKAIYLLSSCGISHLLVLFSPLIFPFFYLNLGSRITVLLILSGYLLGAPVWLWDFFTLPMQVRKKKNQLVMQSK